MTKTKTEYHLRIYNPEGELFISRSGTNKKNVMSEYHKFSKELVSKEQGQGIAFSDLV